MNKAYNPKKVEDKIYKFWQRTGLFSPGKRGDKFVVTMAPLNVTGEAHMGHALENTLIDILVRKKRMQGKKTLWVPGIDHAGIATQNVVEKQLKNKTRFDLGRDKFIKEVWKWKDKYGNIILDQLKKLGLSCDWSRTAFTMDKDYAKAVEQAFLHYYKKGWIYQGKRPINWCPRCQTSLSDLELEYKEKKGKLYYIKYPLKKGFIKVATTRPETMLGDTAVAVNPNDKRYKKLIGQKALLPIVNKQIPIIADKLVVPKFGTGAVKVTPAHDLKDYEIGLRHNLQIIQVIDEKARINGLKTLEIREKILKQLKKLNLLEKQEDYDLLIPTCYRCNTIIEIIPSKQWFLKMDKLAEKAKKVVKKKKVNFYPKNFEKIYFDWLNNIRDWCISRQIWWGHRIPIYYCQKSEQRIKKTKNKMGFAENVVKQVLDNKTCTYRLRNHNLKKGDNVAFENSAFGQIFGTAKITQVKKTIIAKINLKDKKHWKTYDNPKQLIAAFKKHYPEKPINLNTPVYIYTYNFKPVCPPIINKKLCPVCKGKIIQETDVLDTWFSSALWPFAVLGWPKKTKDFKEFYPTDLISSDRGIINLWHARMIFSALEFTNKPPFQKIYIHATILTKTGQRMSKSLGTGIDPLDLINKYGSDATRFGLTWQATGIQDIRFDEQNIVMAKKFCNKVWNASRFVLSQKARPQKRIRTQADKRIISSLNKTIKSMTKDLENFRFGQASQTLYHFFWHDFCDIYIEQSKKEKNKELLSYVLLSSLKLLHPFIPFITEEIYQKLKLKKSIMIEDWPKT